MARNLKYQLKYCVEKNFKEGMDKYSDKKNSVDKGIKVYSYADRKNLIDFTANFANFIKENYEEIKMVKDIKSEHIQDFLNLKSETCTRETLEQYVSKSNKMRNLINITYPKSYVEKFDIEVPVSSSSKQVVKDKQITREHYDLIKDNIKGNGLKAVELATNFGLRVSEITKLQKRDIDLDKREVRVIDGKGQRSRNIPIETKDQWRVAIEIKEITQGDDYQRIVPIRANGVNMSITRAMEKSNLDREYVGNKVHSFRKLYAQESFDRDRDEGYSIKESLGRVSERLGHSVERGEDKELINRYVKNIK